MRSSYLLYFVFLIRNIYSFGKRGCGLIHCRAHVTVFLFKVMVAWMRVGNSLIRASDIVDCRVSFRLFVLFALSQTSVQSQHWKDIARPPSTALRGTSHRIFAVLCSHFWHLSLLCSAFGVHLTFEILF
jgi:hypothetical protein